MSGWTKTASRFHDDLKHAMEPHQGTQLKTFEIGEIIKNIPNLADDVQYIQPPDHCINHTNGGACTCALKGEAIFEQLQRGLYYVRNVA